MLMVVDVHGELWKSETGAKTKQVLRGEPVSSELTFCILSAAFDICHLNYCLYEYTIVLDMNK